MKLTTGFISCVLILSILFLKGCKANGELRKDIIVHITSRFNVFYDHLQLIKEILDPAEEINRNMQSALDIIYPDRCGGLGLGKLSPFRVKSTNGARQGLCEKDADGAGWIVFQRRINGQESFDRRWKDYREGFGSVYGDFWLGNDVLHNLTSKDKYRLRVEGNYGGSANVGTYKGFKVGSEKENFKLTLDELESGVGGLISKDKYGVNNCSFSTKNVKHDSSKTNCATEKNGGFWYNDCSKLAPNGLFGSGILWYDVTGWNRSMTDISLKIKPY